jgi:hypothetical protein
MLLGRSRVIVTPDLANRFDPLEAVGLSAEAARLRQLHASIGIFELSCLAYLWFCVLTRRRERGLALAVAVLVGEGVVLRGAGECPLGPFQRRAGDDAAISRRVGDQLARRALGPGFTK